MTETPVEALGPEPFRFAPQPGPSVEGPAFSTVFKAIAVVLVGGAVVWMASLWSEGKVAGGANSIATWFIAALAMLVYMVWLILRSRTTLDATALTQTWAWEKKMELRELAYGKLVRVPGLDWLIAPRLYVRTLMGKFAVFYAADPVLIREFERLVAELKAFRKF